MKLIIMLKLRVYNFSIQGKSKPFLLYLSTTIFSSNFNSHLFLVQHYFTYFITVLP